MVKGRKPAPRRGRIIQAGAVFSGKGNLTAVLRRGRLRWTELTDDIPGKRPAGRPNSIPIIREEAQRRLAAGGMLETLKRFANELSSWLARQHPDEPAMTPAVVERNIRDLWRLRRR